ncbi:helix-turn-helix domain-containing protein [Ramlibacter sp.]|uniref:helix-turn-helix domain-containing protein n=1 Tax=Ramlibacter sp. TaxID=1917967 RepID=UPI002B5DB32B|nr:helix-turn-helix domain-containing protein [Ramlibacter sp.]HWI83465.1 helix-turn-helix domain-containing protein [Ramlibacter sp.]
MPSTIALAARDRLALIARARRAVLGGEDAGAPLPIEAWVERSWRRCLALGQRPEHHLTFDLIAAPARRRVIEENQPLVRAARPVLERLGATLASSRYFAVLTNHEGIVVDAHGPIDRGDRRADLITRVGVDLSERCVGTTAIGAALTELQPVWLHRGEHFFADTSVYSCAGAPLFGPDGRCVGMLDLTGVEAIERPELKHLAAQSARSIENELVLRLPHALLLRLNWPGRSLGGPDDGLVCLDADGWVLGCNDAARQLLPQLAPPGGPTHSAELFAQRCESWFDLARRSAAPPVEVALWSGLRLQALPQLPGHAGVSIPAKAPLREVEIALIRKAVAEARGNVVKAAQALGISRATVYRKLGRK